MKSKPPVERTVPLHQYNTLYSMWQQTLSENNEYERFYNRLLKMRATKPGAEGFEAAFEVMLQEFGRRMRPILALRKARPKEKL